MGTVRSLWSIFSTPDFTLDVKIRGSESDSHGQTRLDRCCVGCLNGRDCFGAVEVEHAESWKHNVS